MEPLFDADARFTRYERTARLNDPPVSRDRLCKPRFKFPAPAREDVVRAFEVGHSLSEAIYRGDGCWDCPGEYPNTVRSTSNRVRGYILAYHAGGSGINRQSAIEGIERLLSIESEHGCFPCFDHSFKGIRGTDDELLESGPAGCALVEDHGITGDSRLLEASSRTAEREIELLPAAGVTAAMSAVQHLARHFEVTFDQRVLEAAVDAARSVIHAQLPSGGWIGQDSWMWNHGIVIGGLAELLRVLPQGHPLGVELRSSLLAAVNRAIREQAASGEIPPNPRVHVRGYTCAHILDGLLCARAVVGDALDTCIRGIMRYRLSKAPDEPFASAYADAWKIYSDLRDRNRRAATGDVLWRADFSRFVKDVERGEVTVDAVNCRPPGFDPNPERAQWFADTSERTGGGAQGIVSRGAARVGGMGWVVPSGTLIPGRRYRFSASVKRSGDPRNLPVVVCSAYGGKPRPVWDALTGCEFTRENLTFGSYSTISALFTASREMNCVYVWGAGSEIGPGESVSLVVDEAVITDAGIPIPVWDPNSDVRSFERDQDMILLPTAHYLAAVHAAGIRL